MNTQYNIFWRLWRWLWRQFKGRKYEIPASAQALLRKRLKAKEMAELWNTVSEDLNPEQRAGLLYRIKDNFMREVHQDIEASSIQSHIALNQTLDRYNKKWRAFERRTDLDDPDGFERHLQNYDANVYLQWKGE